MLRFVQRAGERSFFECPQTMSPVLHRLLVQRGIASAEEAQAFLHPSKAQLHDPFLLSDMQSAVTILRSAMAKDQRICIYGDYDVDGVCASAILSLYLNEIGADAQVYLPSRHSEGYGLNEAAVRKIAEDYDLLLTVDCGVASKVHIELAESLGLTCIVTDHHRPGDAVPTCPLVNPLLNHYPFPYLCGAGVAFKLVQALGGLDAAMDYIDLAAVATVADVVSLTGENRAIVSLGLERINQSPRPGLRALMDCARLEQGRVNSESIAFRIAPRLNAGGRLGSARRSFELLTEESEFEAVAKADELEQENIRRQSIEKEIRAEALAQLQSFDFSAHRILLVHGKDWNSGVIGLTASHLKEQFHYPVIALSENDGLLTGSCRSIEGVDIFKTLSAAAHLLERFGGHSQAAGLTVKAENLDALQTALDSYLFQNIPSEVYVPFAQYDIEVGLDECDEGFVQALQALEPTGCGNPKPVLRTSVRLVEKRAIGAQGAHLRLIAAQNGVRRTGIFFGEGMRAETLGDTAEILYTPQINLWNGRSEVQLLLSALRERDFEAQIQAAISSENGILRNFLTELIYNKAYTPASLEYITLSELKLRLCNQLQGTLILCSTLEAAREILRRVNPAEPDLFIGRISDDARMYNALCVCPDHLRFPKALRTLVLADVPLPAGIGEEAQVYRLREIESNLWEQLPDVNQMREVYKAALRLSRRPLRIRSAEELDHILADESGQTPLVARASVLALADMKLVALREKPFSFTLPPMHKTNPDDSAVWQTIQRLKKQRRGEE